MTNKEKLDLIFPYLDKTFPDAKCALNYSKDYELLIAVMLSAQTTDNQVNKATSMLFSEFPTLKDLSEADIKDIEKDIAFLGMYRNKAQNVKGIATRLLTDQNGVVPNDPDYLVTLPGVGNKTRNCVLAELYNEPRLALDTHVQRIIKRWKLVKETDSLEKQEEKLMKLIPSERLIKTNHQIIWFGRTICKAQNPKCKECGLRDICSYKK